MSEGRVGQREHRGRTRWFTVRVRESELEALHTAARKMGVWTAELAREGINNRVGEILSTDGGLGTRPCSCSTHDGKRVSR
jgi:hypothetical protein